MDEKYVEKTNRLTAEIDNDNIIKTFKTQAKEPATWLSAWVFLFLKGGAYIWYGHFALAMKLIIERYI